MNRNIMLSYSMTKAMSVVRITATAMNVTTTYAVPVRQSHWIRSMSMKNSSTSTSTNGSRTKLTISSIDSRSCRSYTTSMISNYNIIHRHTTFKFPTNRTMNTLPVLQQHPYLFHTTSCLRHTECYTDDQHKRHLSSMWSHHHTTMNSNLSHRNYSSGSNTNSTTATGPVIRFKDVSYGYVDTHLLLEDVNFSIPQGSKVTIMGQNGSGKSTIVQLITKQISNSAVSNGQIIVRHNERIGYAKQTMPMNCRNITIDQFFMYQLTGVLDTKYNVDDHFDSDTNLLDDIDTANTNSNNTVIVPRHEFLSRKGKVLKAVQLQQIVNDGSRIVSTFSGGQQARLLLAAAMIQNPTILILDEPTNNMDMDGLDHLQNFIMTTDQTCIVISHDEVFLNSFTDMVLYLDIHSKQVETYMGDYYYVKTEISKRIQRENAENVRRQQKAQAKKEQANKFANKGGNLRKIAKTMREVAAEMEEGMVSVRREDISLNQFVIPYTQPGEFLGKYMTISQITGYDQCIPLQNGSIEVRKGNKIHLCGPNGIGKSTFLESIVSRSASGVTYYDTPNDTITIGYYRQDFYNFDFNMSILQCLELYSDSKHTNGELYQIAARFLLRGTNVMKQLVGTLSEGQKGLLSLACLYVQEPTILIMDEPTNHMNFRHIPALIYALSNFDGALILVSHDEHFISQIGPFDTIIDMGKEFASISSSSSKTAANKTAASISV
jgi:ATP-binding cassette, subfamily F, member 3